MTNLYARLVRNENTRTEALVDLLERILKEDQEAETKRFRHFISEVLLDQPTADEEKENFLRTLNATPLNDLSIKTQYQTPTRVIPDIVVLNGNHPICAIEVKTDAPIGEGQLNNYDTFLQEAVDGSPTALVLLTHTTQPPEGFTNPTHEAYRTSLRSVASWNKVAKWFEKNDFDEPLNTLAREFGEFLKEDTMPTLDDVAIARHYLAHPHEALIGAVQNMVAGDQLPDGWSAGQLNRIRPGRIGISGWLDPIDNDSSIRWVSYGLCFNPVDENDEHLYGYQRYENDDAGDPRPVKIEDGFYAFVRVLGPSDECQEIPGYLENQWYGHNLARAEDGPAVASTGWHYYCHNRRGGYAKIRPIQELLDSDGRIGDRLQKWTREVLGDAVQLWNVLF